MTARTWLVPLGALVAVMAASVFFYVERPPDASHATALHEEGIGPLKLGRVYGDAVEHAARLAPDSAWSGVGCGGLDEVRFGGWISGLPASVMGMASDSRLVEIEASLDSPLQAADESACLALRDRFARGFVARFGMLDEGIIVRKPVSREHHAGTGPVVVVARWFPTGRSCYVSAHYRLGEVR
jgi:hypothetical protein